MKHIIRRVSKEPKKTGRLKVVKMPLRRSLGTDSGALSRFQSGSFVHRRIKRIVSVQISYKPGETVIREGEKGELFYIIKEGEGIVTVSKSAGSGQRGAQQKVRTFATVQARLENDLRCPEPA